LNTPRDFCILALAINNPEFRFFDLLVPWVFVIGVGGFIGAWIIVTILELTGLSRRIWHLPLFFVALHLLISSVLGFFFSP
jgi:Protein of unknown function (DUF1656)